MTIALVVNQKFAKNLTKLEKEQAYAEVQLACTGKCEIVTDDKVVKDMNTVKKIFRKYFSSPAPLLDINAPILDSSFTPLATACWLGLAEEVKILLELGADPAISADSTALPLHIAATQGKEAICGYLIEKNPQLINQKNLKGQTSFMKACENGNEKLVKTFLKYNPNIMEKDKDGKSAMDFANKSISTLLLHTYYQQNLSNEKKTAIKRQKI